MQPFTSIRQFQEINSTMPLKFPEMNKNGVWSLLGIKTQISKADFLELKVVPLENKETIRNIYNFSVTFRRVRRSASIIAFSFFLPQTLVPCRSSGYNNHGGNIPENRSLMDIE
jgi:hypothetical protein